MSRPGKLAAAAALLVACTAPADPGAQAPAEPAPPPPCAVAIDVGHTARAPGATSARGVGEFVFNQRIARLLFAELRGRGATQPFIINEEGGDIALRERTEQASAKAADLLISIHHDSLQPRYLSTWTYDGNERPYSDRFRGHSLFYSEKNPEPRASLAVATRIGSHLKAAGFEPTLHHAEEIEGENRDLVDEELGIYIFDDLVVLKTAQMPAVLLECGVILHREEEALLSDPDYQRKLVTTVAAAIEASCSQDLAADELVEDPG